MDIRTGGTGRKSPVISLSNSTIRVGDPGGTVVGVLSATGGNAPYTFTETTNPAFTTSGSNLVLNNPQDINTVDAEVVTIRAVDRKGVVATKTFTLTVLPAVDETPDPIPPPTPPPDPDPPAGNIADLQTAGYIPYYKYMPEYADYASTPLVHSVELAMPTTGGREDLQKPLPDWQTRAVINGLLSHAYEQTLLNADAEKYFAWDFDDSTGKPWNIDTAPNVVLDYRFPGTILSDPDAGNCPGVIDDAHHVQLAYLPFLITHQERWLRVLQYQAQWAMLRYGTSGGLGLIHKSAEQVRGIAHCLMNIGLAAVATTLWEQLGTTPVKPLLSAAYFHQKLDNNLRWLKEITVSSSDPLTTTFRIFPPFSFFGEEQYSLWMNDMVVVTLGWLARMGFTKAQEIFDWAMVGVKARVSGVAGWVGPSTCAYKVNIMPTGGSVVSSWAELWATAIDTSNDYNYITHGALCLAASLGDATAATYAGNLRTTGFSYWRIGNFFDPTERAVAYSPPAVTSDSRYSSFIVNGPPADSTVDNTWSGREYLATAGGQGLFVGSGIYRANVTIVHTNDDYVHVLYNGGGSFRTNMAIVVTQDQTYTVESRTWAPN